MWMQKSVEGSSFSSSGNFHDRNRFGSQYAQGGSYSGGGPPHDAGDWKSKILESGQWLGGKVIEYGGKLARGPTTDSIPDHYAQQMPRNDGRANWMADIRSSTSSYAGGSGSGGYAGGYQNDFATERPKAYSDFSKGYSSNLSDPKAYGGYDPKSVSSSDHHSYQKSRHAKKKNEGKSKKSRKSKKKRQSESESNEESEELSISESSETESGDERRYKSKVKAKMKKNAKKCVEFYSEESESDQDHDKRKASADYSFSFNPAKLPPPPAEDQQKLTTKKTKAKKSKKDKSGKKARSRRHSIASTDDESISGKVDSPKAKKRSSKKAGAAAAASVDLLGVDLDVQPVAHVATCGRPAQEVQLSVFDAPQSQNPLQDLAGLSFAAPVHDPVPTQPSVFDGSASAAASNEAQVHSQSQSDAFRTNLLPENNIVDLSSLVSEKKKTLSANPEEKRTLNDMQKARGADQPMPVMAMPVQGQQQQNMSGSMVQLNMNQLQITDGAIGIQQQMYPNMQMQQMPMQTQMQPQMMMVQPQMAMMSQPQMMNMQMMHQQQFAKGSAATAEALGAANVTSSDPFRQLP